MLLIGFQWSSGESKYSNTKKCIHALTKLCAWCWEIKNLMKNHCFWVLCCLLIFSYSIKKNLCCAKIYFIKWLGIALFLCIYLLSLVRLDYGLSWAGSLSGSAAYWHLCCIDLKVLQDCPVPWSGAPAASTSVNQQKDKMPFIYVLEFFL